MLQASATVPFPWLPFPVSCIANGSKEPVLQYNRHFLGYSVNNSYQLTLLSQSDLPLSSNPDNKQGRCYCLHSADEEVNAVRDKVASCQG